ncbi:MAG: Uma2 family endonuclease [Chloroflexi bacterium]|nr:Uma2 family endonuclease [Chloroflexota bacterium]
MDVKEPPVAVMPPKTGATTLRMSYEEFLEWADEDVHAEWVDGEVSIEMPPKNPHQVLVAFLLQVIGLFARVTGIRGHLLTAPFEVKLWAGGPAREPDLVFVAQEHLDRVTPERIAGAPDLIIEIVSNDSVHRDRVDKFDNYEKAGVAEYWIIDNRPNQKRAWFYQLGPDGKFRETPPDARGIYHSALLPNFWLRVEWLWNEEPNELSALAEIIGPDRFAEALRQAKQAQ